ncbi:MAG: L,D-transpeptidase family protein [Coriobacteriia bacterium]|nr:L,D-transpeptidase family protein [Coriobacteriia bacterium]
MHLISERNKQFGPVARSMAIACIIALTGSLSPVVPAIAQEAAEAPVTCEQTDSHVVYSGAWITYASAFYSGGSHAFTEGPGAAVTIAFIGTRLDLISTVGPKFGIASVSVDGGAATDVDTYGPDTLFAQTVYTTGDLAAGLHVVRVTCTGRKNGSASGAFVSFDAAAITGTVVPVPTDQTDTRLVKRGSWVSYSAPGLLGGSHMFTNVAGNEVAIAFTGTRLDLVSMVGPKYGIASVSVDGGTATSVDMYSADSAWQQVVYSTGDLAYGAHVILVTCSGGKNAAASDTFIGMDAVLVEGVVTQAVMRYEEFYPLLGWNGQFSKAYAPWYSGGRHIWSGPSWGAMAASCVGARIEWVGMVGPQYGIASVSVDGGAPQDVDLYSPYEQAQRVVFSTGDIAYGSHTIVVSWTGRKNPASSGTYISYDAFNFGGDPQQAPTPVAPPVPVGGSFNYPWARYLVVDKSDLRIYLVENGAVTVSYPCAVGKPSTPTPSATWRIGAKYYTDPAGIYGPRKMRLFRQSGSSFVYTAYNIHGTNVDSSVGTYASHGCIRLHNYDVLVLFDMVPLGTMVVTRN